MIFGYIIQWLKTTICVLQVESPDETDGGDSGGGEEDDSSGGSSAASEETPCDIGLMERLIRSHPVWFLPGIQRAGAFHLLQGKEEGVSITTSKRIKYDSAVILVAKLSGEL